MQLFLRRFFRWFILPCAFVVLLLGGAYIFSSYSVRASFDGQSDLPAECAVVFGAAVYGLDRPGPAIVRRVETAVRLYKEGKIERLILTGGTGTGNRESEASVMRGQAMMRGVLPSVITLEEESHSTWENIAFSKPLADDCASVVAISDAYHLGRIGLLAWRQGWSGMQTYPADERPEPRSEQRSIRREVLAHMYYLLFTDVLFPEIPSFIGYDAPAS